MIGVYKITNKVNSKIYVGKSIKIEERWSTHVNHLKNNIHHNNYLQNSWNKYGEENFEFSVLEICEEDILNDKELYWIEHLKAFENGYNLTTGGEGASGYTHSKETKRKLSLAQMGNKKWLGKKHTIETRMKISQGNKNKKISKETKMKISKGNKGKKHSEETKKKFSEMRKGLLAGEKNPMYGKGLKGKDNPMYGKKGSKCPHAKKVYCDGKIFGCVNDCAEYYGVGYSSMRSYLNGGRKMPEKFRSLNLHYAND